MTHQHLTTTHQPAADADNTPASTDTIKTRVIKALAEARNARHHKNCHCRRFEGRYCNAMDAVWTRAMERELSNLHQETTP